MIAPRVRDMFFALLKIGGGKRQTIVKERDMANSYSKVNKQEAQIQLQYSYAPLLKTAALRSELKRVINQTPSFRVSRGVGKQRDRLVEPSSEFFHTIDFHAVHKYVEWDIMHNTWFTLHNLLLRQGSKGVWACANDGWARNPPKMGCCCMAEVADHDYGGFLRCQNIGCNARRSAQKLPPFGYR